MTTHAPRLAAAKPLPALTWAHLGKIPLEIVGFVAVLGGLAFIKGRDVKGGE